MELRDFATRQAGSPRQATGPQTSSLRRAMAISSQDAGLSESAGGLVSTSGIVLAASRTGRYLSIVALLLILWLMRPQANPLVNLLYTGAAVGCLYFAFGRRESFRPLILYAVAFGTFAQLRSMADDTGLPAQFAYVVDMEERGFGVIPSAWLQERFYRPCGDGTRQW